MTEKKAQVLKRNGNLVDYNGSNIQIAISNAMRETDLGVNKSLVLSIESEIYKTINEKFKNSGEIFTIEEISDLIEEKLASEGRFDASKRYILYRDERNRERNNLNKNKYKFLSDEFLSKYKHLNSFSTEMGLFTYIRTYSQFLPQEKRREYWWETVARAVDYNIGLAPSPSIQEAEKLFDNIFNLRQFPSGRTLWAGGGEVSKKYPMSNYNCSFVAIDDMSTFGDLFYLLLVGAGVGFRALPSDVSELPKFRHIPIEHEYYESEIAIFRKEYTELQSIGDEIKIVVGDSKEAWVQSLNFYLEILTNTAYKKVNKIVFNYNNVRPKGERLKTFGGFASGHEAIYEMFKKIDKIIKNIKSNKINPTEVIDICNIIGENVVSGGVRRTAEVALISQDDIQSIQMKNNLYKQNEQGEWEVNLDIIHRQMSNNSIFYEKKPTREFLYWQIEQMRYSGEPAWINAEAGKKRRSNFQGGNPCMEILLDSKQVCNLSEINLFAFVNEDNSINYEDMYEAQRLSTRLGIRMTLPEFELHKWNKNNVRDRLIGVSLTGWQDFVNKTNISKENQIKILQKLRQIAKDESEKYAKELKINVPLLRTTSKPSGTISLLPSVSAGVHSNHAPYYIRRIRTSYSDPIAKAIIKMGYQWHPEVGQTQENMKTIVIDFPMKAPDGKVKKNISAIEQLETYKMFMENYVEHNVSITVHVRNNEWEEVEDWVWNNWDEIVAVSFIPYEDAFYQLMPYEEITKEQYEELLSKTPSFKYSILQEFETGEEFEVSSDCDTGVCPIK